MKVAIITDQHFGARKNSKLFHDYFLKFYNDVFFPTLEKEGITTIIDMGDTFDSRKGIDFSALAWAKDNYYDRLASLGCQVHTIVGNHTTYYKNTNNVNSVDLLLREYDNVKIYPETTEVLLDKLNVLFIPWINQENEESVAQFLNDTTCSLLLGHLELCGFQTIRGVFVEQGYDSKHFNKFEYVFTGHYHVKSSRDNIHYLGTQYQMGFSDVWEEKGFHVFDFKDRSLEFIQNRERLFYTLDYYEESTEKLNYEEFKDKYVKIFIKSKTKQPLFEKYLDKFYEAGVAELAVAEEVTTNPELVAVDIHKDTLQLLHEEVATINDHSIDKNAVAAIINTAYNNALSKEEE